MTGEFGDMIMGGDRDCQPVAESGSWQQMIDEVYAQELHL